MLWKLKKRVSKEGLKRSLASNGTEVSGIKDLDEATAFSSLNDPLKGKTSLSHTTTFLYTFSYHF